MVDSRGGANKANLHAINLRSISTALLLLPLALETRDRKPKIMEDEEDDFYDPTDSVPAGQAQNNTHNAAPEHQQDGYEDEEEEEVEDDDVRSQLFAVYHAY